MINVYDGNNVMMRALNNAPIIGQKAMSMRARFASASAADIWVWDGYGHNDRRKALYPRYKGNRTPPAEDIFSQIKLWKELLCFTAATQIECVGWEADDVIGTLARTNKAAMMIHTNDLDYAQLASRPNVTLNGVKKLPTSARWLPLYKATVGDPSDNIAGIPGFGPKSWDRLEPYAEEFEASVVQGKSFSDRLPLTPSQVTWLSDPDNVEVLQNMLTITHFINVPEDELNAGIIPGVPNFQEGDAILTRYFL